MAPRLLRFSTLRERTRLAARAFINGDIDRPLISWGERGVSGTEQFAGRLGVTEYKPELRPPDSFVVYRKMRRSMAPVMRGLNALVRPLTAATWTIEPADDSRNAQIAAQMIRSNLLDGKGMAHSWNYFLRQALLAAGVGIMPFECVWRMRERGRRGAGREDIFLRKLAPRLPETIDEIMVDPHGGLEGIWQDTTSVVGSTLSPTGRRYGRQWRGSSYRTFIPVVDGITPKLLLSVNDQEGGDFYGNALFRSAYQHWWILSNLYKIQAIAIERRGVGVDVGTTKRTGDERDKFEAALAQLHAAAKQYMVLGDGDEYTVQGLTGSAQDPQTAIDHHELQILAAMSAEYIRLGMNGVGSLALSKAKGSDFALQVNAVGEQLVIEPLERHLFPKWVAMVLGPDYPPPKLTHSRIDVQNTKEWGEALAALAGAGGVEFGLEDETEIRKVLDLPERRSGPRRRPVAPGGVPAMSPPAPAPPMDGGGRAALSSADQAVALAADIDMAMSRARLAGFDTRPGQRCRHIFRRPPTDVELTVDFLRMSDSLDRAADVATGEVGKALRAVIDDTLDRAEELFESGDLEDLRTLDFVGAERIDRAMMPHLRRLFRIGAEEARGEVGRQGASEDDLARAETTSLATFLSAVEEPIEGGVERAELALTKLALEDGLDLDDPEQLRVWLALQAATVRAIVQSRLRPTLLLETLGATGSGALDRDDIASMLAGLSAKEVRSAVQNTIAEALSMGRRAEQQRLADLATKSQYSAIGDENTCGPCADMDGTVTETGSPLYVMAYPPLRAPEPCEGRHRCRCDWILILDRPFE